MQNSFGGWQQVSRLGMPLTNEAVIPVGDKDYWNTLTPYREDADHFNYFYNPELALYMDDDLFRRCCAGVCSTQDPDEFTRIIRFF